MPEITSSLALAISICALLCAVICVVVCSRAASVSSSMAKASRRSAELAESFDSRIKTLEERWQNVAKREHLNARRDPVSGRSMRTTSESKDDVKKRLGLVGSNAARVAHTIHAQGGLR